jgi:peptidoglycan L-alanyl-D-glutamate endopeptidase CwlK
VSFRVMPFKFSRRSLRNLKGVHPDLVAVARKAILMTTVDFAVIEGLRTKERQRELKEAGASWTMKSRHLTGHAIDVAPYLDGKLRWDWPLFDEVAAAMKEAALSYEVALNWGGDWQSKKDGPHFELARRMYPGNVMWDENPRNKIVTL